MINIWLFSGGSGNNIVQNRTMVPVCPQGISMSNDNTNNCISVASFNLLAPLYIRPVDQRTGKVQPFASFEV